MKMTIRSIPPLDRIAKNLRRIPSRIDNRMQKAIKQSAFMIEAESKKKTPVDTGRLRASIYTVIKSDSATVQPKTNYALAVHEGTSFMKGRPFMFEGTKKAFPRIKSLFAEQVGLSIRLK